MRLSRRHLIAAALAVAGRSAHAAPAAGVATLLVPGPADGATARWAATLAMALTHPMAPRLDALVLGGPDGVTAANRFATAAGPDGRMLLVLNGAATQARLVGETRARFDAAGWLPVCASLGGATVFGHGELHGRATPVRLALPGPDAPEAAALLVFDLLGVPAVPILGIGDPGAALATGHVDAAVLHAMPTAPCTPWFALGEGSAPGSETGLAPDAGDLLGAAQPALRAAVRAAGVSARLDAALVLPALTAADQVARWRAAARQWVAEDGNGRRPEGPPIVRPEGPLGVRPDGPQAVRPEEPHVVRPEGRQAAWSDAPRAARLDGPRAAAMLAAAMPSPEATLAYREWLLRRFAGRSP